LDEPAVSATQAWVASRKNSAVADDRLGTEGGETSTQWRPPSVVRNGPYAHPIVGLSIFARSGGVLAFGVAGGGMQEALGAIEGGLTGTGREGTRWTARNTAVAVTTRSRASTVAANLMAIGGSCVMSAGQRRRVAGLSAKAA